MENIISQIEQFILKNAWGVILAGAIASVLGTLLCYLFRKLRDYLAKKYKIRKKKQKTKRYMSSFYRGAVASYAKLSSYRQVLLVGDCIIDIVCVSLKIIAYLLVACIFIIMSNNLFLDMVIIAVCSFMIYPQVIIIKETEKAFKMTYDYVFGVDHMDKIMKGAFDTLKKNQENNEQTTEKEN